MHKIVQEWKTVQIEIYATKKTKFIQVITLKQGRNQQEYTKLYKVENTSPKFTQQRKPVQTGYNNVRARKKPPSKKFNIGG